MERRAFMALGGAALAAGGLGMAPASGAPAKPTRPGRKPLLMKLGCQSEPSTEEHFAFFARYGIHNVCAKPETSGGRLYSTVEELEKLKAMGARHELAIDMVQPILLPSSHIDREAHPAIMLADSPERDRDIEAFQTLIRNCAKAGIPAIKYNMSLLGVLRVGDVPGRGDVRYLEWDAATAKPKTPLTKAGPVNADAFWERITYFLDRVVPVANEYKVRIACHPHDPGVPPSGYQGIDRVLGTIDGLKRFVSIRESAYHGLNFCQGTISEDLADPNTQIHDVIRWFGTRKKIFNVHFRNIRGHRDKFLEVYPDEGSVDMVRALETYREVGYDGMIMPDHVPEVPGDNGGARLASFAFCYGYIRGLMQSAERLA
ncbi:mannonate dehydratase [Sphingomonas sp. AP4-R1]|uniref:mannonate dehydratase n=1 Tax=Sphingomonas sp. AP4-R1 TaxID=2735134 RepID=UPI0014938413|nr:mannonate dehydratase [Sphingomonas sp. AP4-R1]